jgi:anti-sigma B factor antagonist
LDIIADRGAAVPVLRLIGEIDVTNVDTLRQRIQEQFDQGADSLAFDLTQVSFIDSVGIGALFGAKRRAVEREGEIYLLEPSGVLQRLMSLLSMERMFALCTIAEFRAKFAAPLPESTPHVSRGSR